jgi:hypothetical protein
MIAIGSIVARLRRQVNLREEFAAFKSAFGTEGARKYVLPVLIQFTGLCVPAPIAEGEFAQGRAAGRRDVMLLIQHYLNLDEHDIYDMLKSNPIKPEDMRHG